METVSVEQATELILERTKAIDETEEIEAEDALGRILAEDMRAEFDNPPFDRSPIDGYACRSVDIAGASEERPVRLKVVEEVYAGAYTDREVRKGEAVRIMTGAPVPVGCDCCVRQEDTDYGEEVVRIFRPEKEWGNYCFRGEDFKAGSVLMKKGSRIGFVEMGVLAGMGRGTVPVYRLPRVAILTTGDEVVTPGDPLLPGKIYDSNRMLLMGRLTELGVRPSLVRWVEDRPEAMADTLREAAQKVDLILTTGAVSVGKKDIMHEALKIAGAERVFWKVKVKPGMPTLFSVYRGVPVLSLSGNPFGVAAMTELLVRPAVQKMKRDDSIRLVRVKGIMADTFSKPSKGRRLIRAYWENGMFHLPKGLHSNGVLASMIGCNCLIDMRPGDPELKEGAPAEAILL